MTEIEINNRLDKQKNKIMKKIILVALLALGVAFSSNAQKTGYGVLLGGNISGIRETPEQLYLGTKFGFQIGGFIDYYLAENIFTRANFSFVTKGARNEATALGLSIYTNINPMYLQLPVVIGYSFSLNKDINFNLSFGAYLAFGIAGESDSEIKGNGDKDRNVSVGYFKETNDEELIYLGNNNRFDYGLRFGVGFDINRLLFFSIDYDLGLANVYDDKYITNYYSKENYSLGLTLGYRF